MILLRIVIPLLLATSVFAQTTKDQGNITFQPNITFSTPIITLGGGKLMEIFDKNEKLMVSISEDGKVTYGEGYKADDGAKTFWEVLSHTYPEVCRKKESEK